MRLLRFTFALVAGFLGSLSLVTVQAAQEKSVQIGLSDSFLTDRPQSFIDIAAKDFKEVMKKATGLDGDVTTRFEAIDVAKKLQAKEFDFGIFHGIEFAWLQKKYPDFQPLLIATKKDYQQRAYVIVHKNSPIKSIADLQGKKVDMPMNTKEHSRVFLRKLTMDAAKKAPAEFFKSVEKSSSPNNAMDQVAREKVEATVVDTHSLDFYKEVRGPVFEKNLRALQQSEAFPQDVIVYKPGNVDQKIVDQFRNGILKAHTIPEGADMMKEWNIERFEAIPKDYQQRLADIAKAYPMPDMGK